MHRPQRACRTQAQVLTPHHAHAQCTWRTLSDEEKSGALGDGAAALLKANPTLIKRPVIDTGADILVGWDSGAQQALTQ